MFRNDAGMELEELQPYHIDPHHLTLRTSTSTDLEAKEAKNKQYKIECKADIAGFMKRKQALEVNISKAYAFLWEPCAKGMESNVESHMDFNSKV